MLRPGAGVLTIVHDPEDDSATVHSALAAHDRELRQVTIHPTVGTTAARMIALDVLTALGMHITAETIKREHLSTPDRAFSAAAAWLTAYEIDVVIVVRAHLLSAAARHGLSRLATDAAVRVVAIWHGRRPDDWAEAFGHAPSMTREIEEVEAALAGARRRRGPEPPPDPAS